LEAELRQFLGWKMVEKYIKAADEEDRRLRHLSWEDMEVAKIRKEEQREKQGEWDQLERVLGTRFITTQDHAEGVQQYHCKWVGLDYQEISWEEEEDLLKA
jgi:hypothetical protein